MRLGLKNPTIPTRMSTTPTSIATVFAMGLLCRVKELNSDYRIGSAGIPSVQRNAKTDRGACATRTIQKRAIEADKESVRDTCWPGLNTGVDSNTRAVFLIPEMMTQL